MRFGIRHVAEQAGVSATTVSQVLAGRGRYSPETIARVKKTAKAQQYRPSRRARAMQAGRNHCLTMLADIPVGMDSPYQALILTGVALEARRAGYSVELVETIERTDLRPILQDTDGVIASAVIQRTGLLDQVAEYGLPFVRVNPGVCGHDDCVAPDDEGGAAAVGRRLCECGYQRVVYFWHGLGAGLHASGEIRARALEEAVRGMEFRRVALADGQAADLLRDYCSDGRGRTAFVGYSDIHVLPILVAGARLGLECPRDFGLAACHLLQPDDFKRVGVDLCGATHGLEHMGREAGRIMLDKLHHENRPVPSVLIPEVLHEGASLRRAP